MMKHMTVGFLTFGLSSERAVGLPGLVMSVTLTHAYSANVNRAYMAEPRAVKSLHWYRSTGLVHIHQLSEKLLHSQAALLMRPYTTKTSFPGLILLLF